MAQAGKDTVLWSFNRVKKSHECYLSTEGIKTCYCYTIKPREERVVSISVLGIASPSLTYPLKVASAFMHERFGEGRESEPLVVATEHDVFSIDSTPRRAARTVKRRP